MRQVSRGHLQVHNGSRNDRSETVDQPPLSNTNQRRIQPRIRELLDDVEDARRPNGRPAYTDRQLKVLTRLALHANDEGVARISLAQLARERQWDYSNLCGDVRVLVVGGVVIRRPSPTRRGYFEYVIPAMEAPIRGA